MAGTKKTTKKTTKTAKKTTKKTQPANIIPTDREPTNEDIRLESFDWGEDCKLSDKQKYFVIWYTFPGRTYRKCLRSALKAGYTPKTANVMCGSLRRNPAIVPYIKKFDEMYMRESLDDFYHKAIQDKIARATFDINDFYETKEYIDGDGNKREYISMKKPSELTPEQRKCVDGIKINNNGTPSYDFANRTHETEVLMKLRELANGERKNDGVQAELTIEQIKDKVTTKLKIIQQKDEEEILAGSYIDEPENLVEEA